METNIGNNIEFAGVKPPYIVEVDPTLTKQGQAADARVTGSVVERSEQAAERAESAVEKYPYIGDNGDWYVWDANEGEFVDTGVSAKGRPYHTITESETAGAYSVNITADDGVYVYTDDGNIRLDAPSGNVVVGGGGDLEVESGNLSVNGNISTTGSVSAEFGVTTGGLYVLGEATVDGEAIATRDWVDPHYVSYSVWCGNDPDERGFAPTDTNGSTISYNSHCAYEELTLQAMSTLGGTDPTIFIHTDIDPESYDPIGIIDISADILRANNKNIATQDWVENVASGKQDALVSGTNIKTIDGQSVLGSGDLAIKTYKAIPNSWTTNSTTETLCQSIVSDSTATAGMVYLGIIRCSDLPASMVQAEAVIEIISSSGANGKDIHITVTSVEVSPYHWEYNYAKVNGSYVNTGWIGYQTQLSCISESVDGISISGSGGVEISSGDFIRISGLPTIISIGLGCAQLDDSTGQGVNNFIVDVPSFPYADGREVSYTLKYFSSGSMEPGHLEWVED